MSAPLAIELFAGSFGWSAGWLELGSLATDGFSIEHMPAAEVRKQYCGCRCK